MDKSGSGPKWTKWIEVDQRDEIDWSGANEWSGPHWTESNWSLANGANRPKWTKCTKVDQNGERMGF